MLKQTFYHQINTKRGIQVNLTKNPSLENASISDSDRKPILIEHKIVQMSKCDMQIEFE